MYICAFSTVCLLLRNSRWRKLHRNRKWRRLHLRWQWNKMVPTVFGFYKFNMNYLCTYIYIVIFMYRYQEDKKGNWQEAENLGSQKMRCLRIPERVVSEPINDSKMGILPNGHHQRPLSNSSGASSNAHFHFLKVFSIQKYYISTFLRLNSSGTETQSWFWIWQIWRKYVWRIGRYVFTLKIIMKIISF